MNTRNALRDPKWQEMSASRREGKLLVKLPVTKAHDLLHSLAIILRLEDLPPDTLTYLRKDFESFLREEVQGCQEMNLNSLIYTIPLSTAQKDVDMLGLVETFDETGLIKVLRETLIAGIQGESKVDWISRVGGPPPAPELQPASQEPIELDITELFPDDEPVQTP